MKKLTIEQTRKEIFKLESERSEIIRSMKYKTPEIYKNNKAALIVLAEKWQNEVRKAADKTEPRKAEITAAHDMAQRIVKVLKQLS